MPDFGNPLREIRKFLHGKTLSRPYILEECGILRRAFPERCPNAGSRGNLAFQGKATWSPFPPAAEKRVIFLIADLGRVQRMIQIIMPFQFGRQFFALAASAGAGKSCSRVRNIFMRVIFLFSCPGLIGNCYQPLPQGPDVVA